MSISLTAVLNNHGGAGDVTRGGGKKTRQVVTGQDKKRSVREETQAETELLRVERRGKGLSKLSTTLSEKLVGRTRAGEGGLTDR